MKPLELMLRCMARREGDVWVAICLEFDLAAQGATFDEARQKLDEQIGFYVNDALTQDREHAGYLLKRRAPLHYFAIFYACKALSRIDHLWRDAKAFCAAMPMQPSSHCRA